MKTQPPNNRYHITQGSFHEAELSKLYVAHKTKTTYHVALYRKSPRLLPRLAQSTATIPVICDSVTEKKFVIMFNNLRPAIEFNI